MDHTPKIFMTENIEYNYRETDTIDQYLSYSNHPYIRKLKIILRS